MLDFYRKVETAQQTSEEKKSRGDEDSRQSQRSDERDYRTRKRSRGNSFADEVDSYRASRNHQHPHQNQQQLLASSSLAASGGSIPDDNVGHQMLRGLGWQDGEGLGQSRSGITAPVQAAEQQGRTGLGGGGDARRDFSSYRSSKSAGYHRS